MGCGSLMTLNPNVMLACWGNPHHDIQIHSKKCFGSDTSTVARLCACKQSASRPSMLLAGVISESRFLCSAACFLAFCISDGYG